MRPKYYFQDAKLIKYVSCVRGRYILQVYVRIEFTQPCTKELSVYHMSREIIFLVSFPRQDNLKPLTKSAIFQQLVWTLLGSLWTPATPATPAPFQRPLHTPLPYHLLADRKIISFRRWEASLLNSNQAIKYSLTSPPLPIFCCYQFGEIPPACGSSFSLLAYYCRLGEF